MSEQDGRRTNQPDPKPMHEDRIRKAIFELTLQLHTEGHTRKEIVARLRDIADDYEDYWSDKDSWDKSPSEKNVVLPGDYEDD